MTGETTGEHSRFCSCAACGSTPAALPLDRDTILAYAHHVYDPSGWKTTRYGDPTVRVLIVGGRLQPVNRSLAEIDSAIIAYSTRIARLSDLSLAGPTVSAVSAISLTPFSLVSRDLIARSPRAVDRFEIRP